MGDRKTPGAIEAYAEAVYGVDVDGEAIEEMALRQLEHDGVIEIAGGD